MMEDFCIWTLLCLGLDGTSRDYESRNGWCMALVVRLPSIQSNDIRLRKPDWMMDPSFECAESLDRRASTSSNEGFIHDY